MNINVSRCQAIGVFIYALCLISFSANASERDRALKICNSDYKLSLKHDCQCWADSYSELKAKSPERTDKSLLAYQHSQCQKADNLSQVYMECIDKPQITTTTMETYCGCITHELKKIQEKSGKSDDSTEYNMSDAHMAKQTCDAQYMPRTQEKNLPIKKKWDKRTAELQYKKAFNEGYSACTDFGLAPGQSAEKTKIRQYLYRFCPYIKDIMASVPTIERDRIVKDVLDLEKELYQTFKNELSGLPGKWGSSISLCEKRDEACHKSCEPNRLKTGRETCGCGTQLLTCLGAISLDLQ